MGFGGSGGSGSGSVSTSSDVALSNVSNGHVLQYDTTASKWKNGTLSKTAVGLNNVDNTADSSKPISDATQTALNTKVGSSNGSVLNIVRLTQAQYDALGSKPSTTFYVIVG